MTHDSIHLSPEQFKSLEKRLFRYFDTQGCADLNQKFADFAAAGDEPEYKVQKEELYKQINKVLRVELDIHPTA